MPARFQLKKGTTGKFRFVLLSSNGQVVATSQTYERKASALAGIRSVQKISADAPIEDTTTKEWADAEAVKKAAVKKVPVKKAAAKSPAKASSSPAARVKRVASAVVEQAQAAVSQGVDSVKETYENLVERVTG